MDWDRVIARNREALLRIVAALIALAGPSEDPSPNPRIARHLHRAILRVLRPAETATRRLIVIAAHSLTRIHPPFGAFLYGLDPDKARGRHPAGPGGASDAPTRTPPFALADPVKRFSAEPPQRRSRAVPRILFLDGPPPPPLPPAPSPWDPVEAGSLFRRLRALRDALGDLDAQAQRLVRWQARRERAFSCPTRLSPMRTGRPPGRRRRGAHEVDDLLATIDALARQATAPDTS